MSVMVKTDVYDLAPPSRWETFRIHKLNNSVVSTLNWLCNCFTRARAARLAGWHEWKGLWESQ